MSLTPTNVAGPCRPTAAKWYSLLISLPFAIYSVAVGETYGPAVQALDGANEIHVVLGYWPRLILLAGVLISLAVNAIRVLTGPTRAASPIGIEGNSARLASRNGSGLTFAGGVSSETRQVDAANRGPECRSPQCVPSNYVGRNPALRWSTNVRSFRFWHVLTLRQDWPACVAGCRCDKAPNRPAPRNAEPSCGCSPAPSRSANCPTRALSAAASPRPRPASASPPSAATPPRMKAAPILRSSDPPGFQF